MTSDPLEKQRRIQERIEKTRKDAIAFVEDMEHIRDILQKDRTSRASIRRLTPIIRRLLTDKGGDIPKIAAPRGMKIAIKVPEHSRVLDPKSKYIFIACGGGVVHRMQICMATIAIIDASNQSQELDTSVIVRMGDNYDLNKDKDTYLDIDISDFIKESVIFWSGKHYGRLEIIEFLAYVLNGVHSDEIRKDFQKELAEIAARFNYMIYADGQGVEFRPNLEETKISDTLNFEDDRISVVLFELLSIAQFLVDSPDIKKLEESIREEIAGLADI